MNKKKWLRPHHVFVRNLLFLFIYPYSKIRYGLKIEKYSNPQKRPHLILMNHQTPFDQFFAGMVYPGAVYYVASEDLFSNGITSKIIKFLVNPIPIQKNTADIRAVKTCLRVAREGGTIAIAPEGNRTYDGKPCYIKESTASLARALKLPIALLRIEGGYGCEPRWSNVIRKGSVSAQISRVIEPEEYAQMSDSELYGEIVRELDVRDAESGKKFYHKKSAEFLERALYICPECNGFCTLESRGEELSCTACGHRVKYTEDLTFEKGGEPYRFSTVAEWSDYQKKHLQSLDMSMFADTPIHTEKVLVREIIPYKSRKKIGIAEVELFSEKVKMIFPNETLILHFSELLGATVLGRNKLNLYCQNRTVQFKGEKRFNALKYMNLFYIFKNADKGEKYGEFLGI